MTIGRTTWVIVDGWIPPGSTGPAPDFTSHDTVCILNPGDNTADVQLRIYLADQDPLGPYTLTVGPHRVLHQRVNDLKDPPVPVGTDFSVIVESTEPIVVQHTRLDSRQAENSIMTTIAYPA
jgi:hypothetical protein